MNPGQTGYEQKIILSGLIFQGRVYAAFLNTFRDSFKKYADIPGIFSIAKCKKIIRHTLIWG
jgi:hypothetical protein